MTTASHNRRRGRVARAAFFGASVLVCVLLCGIAGLVYGLTEFARSLSDLADWHLQAPASEFRAADARPGYTFESYLAQEARAFKELGALVAGPWSKQPQGRYCRFRSGSPCDPETVTDRNWNRTFVLEPADPVAGALLVHGLSDSPYSMRRLAQRLHAEGYAVIGLRVPGHGTCPRALAEAHRADWSAAVRVAVRGLRARLPDTAPLALVGFSNGGALSIDYALSCTEDEALPRASAVVLLSPMIGITPMARLTRFHRVIALVSGERKADWSYVGAEIDPFKYSSWPMNASVQAWKLTQRLEQGLAALERDGRVGAMPPVLAMQSAVDATVVVPVLIRRLFDRLEPGSGELVLFDVNRARRLAGLLNPGLQHDIVPMLEQVGRPFRLTVVTNVAPDALEVVARTRDAGTVTDQPLGLSWPHAVFSLSHVALPIAPDDPILGTAEATAKAGLPLGSLDLRGETGVLLIADGQILRLRHNPFYSYVEDRIVAWLAERLGQVRDGRGGTTREGIAESDR